MPKSLENTGFLKSGISLQLNRVFGFASFGLIAGVVVDAYDLLVGQHPWQGLRIEGGSGQLDRA